MLAVPDTARPSMASLLIRCRKYKRRKSDRDILKEMQTINKYKIIENFNTMKLLADSALQVEYTKQTYLIKSLKV